MLCPDSAREGGTRGWSRYNEVDPNRKGSRIARAIRPFCQHRRCRTTPSPPTKPISDRLLGLTIDDIANRQGDELTRDPDPGPRSWHDRHRCRAEFYVLTGQQRCAQVACVEQLLHKKTSLRSRPTKAINQRVQVVRPCFVGRRAGCFRRAYALGRSYASGEKLEILRRLAPALAVHGFELRPLITADLCELRNWCRRNVHASGFIKTLSINKLVFTPLQEKPDQPGVKTSPYLRKRTSSLSYFPAQLR